MLLSMTGYGKSIIQLSSKKITIELRSLNSKNMDLNVRMSSQYKEKELDIRKKVAKSLVRGKVDFSIYIENTAEETSSQINLPIVNEYITQLSQIQSSSESDLLSIAMRLPDAMKTTREEFDEEEWEVIEEGIHEALEKLQLYRKDEGDSMTTDLKQNIESIDRLMQEVKELAEARMTHVKQRLKNALEELSMNVDENRFEQEMIYYLEKLDINEEMVRLENHLNYFNEELNSPISNGKKLGFIAQELGREINTTGSKSNYAPMQHVVVKMKNELEKIKEQILNIL
ncbi:YicC family protein [Flavobacteriaceae bacterium]|nr:YicC family protein [Flavobacteriaceae bacterium]